MGELRSDWVGVFVLLVVFFFLAYFGWINKTSRSIWAASKTDPYNPGYGYVYWCRAVAIGFGVIAFGFIIALLVSCKGT